MAICRIASRRSSSKPRRPNLTHALYIRLRGRLYRATPTVGNICRGEHQMADEAESLKGGAADGYHTFGVCFACKTEMNYKQNGNDLLAIHHCS